MNTIIIPILIDGTEKIAEFRFERTHVGVDGQDTYKWEWGCVSPLGWQPIEDGEVQHPEHLGVFNLFHRVLSIVLQKKDAR